MRVLVVRLIFKLVAEAKLVIKKRQKLIKIAAENRYGWLVVQEYETDDLASDSEDEKIRKARAAAEKKRKEAKSNIGNTTGGPDVVCDLHT